MLHYFTFCTRCLIISWVNSGSIRSAVLQINTNGSEIEKNGSGSGSFLAVVGIWSRNDSVHLLLWQQAVKSAHAEWKHETKAKSHCSRTRCWCTGRRSRRFINVSLNYETNFQVDYTNLSIGSLQPPCWRTNCVQLSPLQTSAYSYVHKAKSE